MPRDSSKNFTRKRLMNPKVCARKSFRVKRLKGGKELTVCCPRGKFKRGRCTVGMKAQSLATPKRSGLGIALADEIKSVRIVRD